MTAVVSNLEKINTMKMLDDRTIEIVKSTVPVLQVHGEAITRRFYERLFEAHPELLNMFNHAHQQQGQQQMALANAVYAAAQHIDNLSAILPSVRQIGHKHRGLGVKKEHYPVVGENLLLAIQDVLGSAATPDILAAWEKAYGVIASTFMQMEQQFDEQASAQPGGWSGFRSFQVKRKVKESDVITSFYLEPVDQGAIAYFIPGQYITVRVQPKDQPFVHLRQYSLSDAPGLPYYRISVKKESAIQEKPAGVVSSYLHEQIGVGDVIEVSAPAGAFTLDRSHDLPIVLISGGVGLTPMISMLNTLIQSGDKRPIVYIHAALQGSVHAFANHVEELAETHSHLSVYTIYEKPTVEDEALQRHQLSGYITDDFLRPLVPQNADVYFCGPTPFMQAVYRILHSIGIQEDRIHYEFFGPEGVLTNLT